MADNEDVTIREIAEHLDTSVRAVEKQIMKLKTEKKIKRISARKGGHWEVIKHSS